WVRQKGLRRTTRCCTRSARRYPRHFCAVHAVAAKRQAQSLHAHVVKGSCGVVANRNTIVTVAAQLGIEHKRRAFRDSKRKCRYIAGSRARSIYELDPLAARQRLRPSVFDLPSFFARRHMNDADPRAERA